MIGNVELDFEGGRVMKAVVGFIFVAGLVAGSARAQSTETWNGLPDRFQIDTGYFRLNADTVLRLESPAGGSGEVDFERDLGIDEEVDTFWVDGTWRVGRRHQLKLAFTRLSRERGSYTLQRDFTWGGQTYNAGLTATTTTGSEILGGYYRFAIVRSDRFEVGPTLGVGYLWLDARIQATGSVSGPGGSQQRSLDRAAEMGSITGAVGGYARAWPAKRLVVEGDFLYIKVELDGDPASVTDWRLAADYYFHRNVGLGVQYKFNRYRQDRAVFSSELGGELTFQGIQAFLTFRF
jgi:hypothetical protein